MFNGKPEFLPATVPVGHTLSPSSIVRSPATSNQPAGSPTLRLPEVLVKLPPSSLHPFYTPFRRHEEQIFADILATSPETAGRPLHVEVETQMSPNCDTGYAEFLCTIRGRFLPPSGAPPHAPVSSDDEFWKGKGAGDPWNWPRTFQDDGPLPWVSPPPSPSPSSGSFEPMGVPPAPRKPRSRPGHMSTGRKLPKLHTGFKTASQVMEEDQQVVQNFGVSWGEGQEEQARREAEASLRMLASQSWEEGTQVGEGTGEGWEDVEEEEEQKEEQEVAKMLTT